MEKNTLKHVLLSTTPTVPPHMCATIARNAQRRLAEEKLQRLIREGQKGTQP